MKKLFFVLLTGLAISFQLMAQEAHNDFFIGKWNIIIEGTPKGDAQIHVTIEKKDGELKGSMLGITEGDTVPSKFDRIEVDEDGITMYWVTPDGYSVYLFIEQDDEESIIGTMADSFDVKGKRIKE